MGNKMIVPGVFDFNPDVPEQIDDLERLEILARLSRLPIESRRTERFFNFEDIEGRKEGLEACFQLIRGEIQPPMLMLYGLPGRSKSRLAKATAWSFIGQLKSACYYQVGDLLDDLRSGMRIQKSLQPGEFVPDSSDAILNFVKRCSLLVLDDLGVHNETDWAVEKLDTIVNHRYENALATIITANSLEISDRIYDRMCQGRVVMLKGPSYRQLIMERRKVDG